jgi:hypothetical protein
MPRDFHFIWFGSCLPAEYQKNILSFKSYNPAYPIILWTDYKTLSQEARAAMEHFCATEGIELRNIRHQELTNQDLIDSELDRSLVDRKEMARIHYVRASDLARVAVLIKHGGIYNDTDSKCKNALPEQINLPHGFLSQTTGINELNFEENRESLLESIYYHFMMAEPNNAILKLAAEISRLDYETYHASKNKLWETFDHHQSHLCGTIKLTGTSIKWAINYLRQEKKIILSNMEELFLDASQFSTSTFNKSWLQDFPRNHNASEYDESDESDECDESLDNFCQEIERNRQQQYPLRNPSGIQHSKDSFSGFRLHDELKFRLFKFDNTVLEELKRRANLNPNVESPSFELPSFKMDFKPSTDPFEFTPVQFDFKIPPPDISSLLVGSLKNTLQQVQPTHPFEFTPVHFDFKIPPPDIFSLLVGSLKNTLQQVQQEYLNYSLTHCQYSLFHAHGVTGRKRVNEWMSKIELITDISSLQQEILAYLQDNSNGNTYPHSFRMMLITRLCEQTDPGSTPHFDDLLVQLTTEWCSSLSSSSEYRSAEYCN